jgi:NADH dehydrogenase FAD-containing subunit
MSVEQVESLIIGGGQAGIEMSAQLSKRFRVGRQHREFHNCRRR